jgi:hypothetical protein
MAQSAFRSPDRNWRSLITAEVYHVFRAVRFMPMLFPDFSPRKRTRRGSRPHGKLRRRHERGRNGCDWQRCCLPHCFWLRFGFVRAGRQHEFRSVGTKISAFPDTTDIRPPRL